MDKYYLDQIINDYSNTETSSMNESVKEEVASTVLDKIFVLTIGKYNKIDFREVEASKGDVTRMKYYKNLNECISSLYKMYNDPQNKETALEDILVIKAALDNVIALKNNFMQSFKIKNNCGIMMYNLTVFSIMEATSYLIASAMNVVKEGDLDVIKFYDSRDNLLVSQLAKFNECAENGSIYKFIASAENSNKYRSQNESIIDPKTIAKFAIIGTLAIAALGAIIPFIREMAYTLYRTNHNISDAAEVQAIMLESNIQRLEMNNGDSKVIARQKKWVDRFRRISNKFALDTDRARRNAKQDIKNDKVDMNNIVL